MNKRKRDSLKKAISYLQMSSSIIEDVTNEEQDAMDNMPENLQGSYRYEVMECAIDRLERAIESIDEARDYIEESMS